MKALALTLLLVAATLPVIHAQQKNDKWYEMSDKQSRSQEKEGEKAEKARRNAAEKFTVEYDKFKDETAIRSGEIYPEATGKLTSGLNPFSFRLVAWHKGAQLREPVRGGYFYFSSRSKSWKFLRSNDLIILADGERIAFPETRHDGRIELGGVREYMTVAFDAEQIERIANAKKVELQLGFHEYELKPHQIFNFEEILRRMRPGLSP